MSQWDGNPNCLWSPWSSYSNTTKKTISLQCRNPLCSRHAAASWFCILKILGICQGFHKRRWSICTYKCLCILYETASFCIFLYLGLNLATDVVFRSGRHLTYGHAQSKLLRFPRIWETHMYLKILHCISVDGFQILWCPAKASSYFFYGSLDFRQGFIHNRHKSFTALPERTRTVLLGSQAVP